MKHIQSDQLREYLFKLLDDETAQNVATHLEHCKDCRSEFESIQKQFAALDLLNDQPEVSEESVLSVLRPPQKRPMLLRPLWALAASVVIALGLFQFVKTAHKKNDFTLSASAPVVATGTKEKSLDELRAEKPFAPASNIELNVLPKRDSVQLTIYNAEDLTLVREKRKLVLKRGWNWLQFMWNDTLIDPTSLSLEPQTHADQVEITQLVYPPRLKDLARWTIFSEVSGEVEFELTYLTSGLKWNAFYEATLSSDEQKMHLRSFVRVDNHSGEDYKNAQTRLVIGKIHIEDKIIDIIHQKYPYNRPDNAPKTGLGFSMPEICFMGVVIKPKSEYYLYTIEGRETIPNGWGKRLPSFVTEGISVTNLYRYDEERWGTQAIRFLSFANSKACQLGETPLPSGRVRVFKTVPNGSNLNYVEASRLQYIPVGEKVKLVLGVARKVLVKAKKMGVKTEQYLFDQDGNVVGWDEVTQWKIDLTNTKNIPVRVEITRAVANSYWTLKTAASFSKHDKTHFRFTVLLPPQSKQKIEYELTTKHGTRQNGNRSIK